MTGHAVGCECDRCFDFRLRVNLALVMELPDVDVAEIQEAAQIIADAFLSEGWPPEVD